MMKLTTYDPAAAPAQAEPISETLENGDAKVIAHAMKTIKLAVDVASMPVDIGALFDRGAENYFRNR
jgi:hypothetical protein